MTRLGTASALSLVASFTICRPLCADPAAAQALFDRGKELVKSGQLEEGCSLLAQSQSEDPSPGTLASLGDCQERRGQTATAWTTFKQAITLAQSRGRQDIAVPAQSRAQALEARLTRLRLKPTTQQTGLVVFVGQTRLSGAAIDVPLPVNPGRIEVRAEAPGAKPWRTSVEVASGESTHTITIPELLPDTSLTPSAPPQAASTPPERRSPPRIAEARVVEGVDRVSERRRLAIVVGAAGLGLTAVGSVFGVLALQENHTVQQDCPEHRFCSDNAAGAAARRDRDAWIANGGIGVGLLGVAAGISLYLTAPNAAAPRPVLALLPQRGGAYAQLGFPLDLTSTLGGDQ